MRRAVAVGGGLVVAALGALIVGEYQFKGVAALVIGLLFGLAVAEVVVWLADARPAWLVAATAALTAAGLVWAGWISVRNSHRDIPLGAWLAALVGAVTAAVRSRGGSARSAGSDSSTGP
jgi:hypothetical protein